MNKVSVIIPIYNSEENLSRCVESVLAQSYKEIEIICINDGSTDASLNILEEYQKDDTRLMIVDIENQGVSHARNIGLERSDGKYVVFVDSDDMINVNMIRELYYRVECEFADLAVCGYTTYRGNVIFEKQELKEDILTLEQSVNYLMSTGCLNMIWNKMYRREKIASKFREDMAFGEDLLFNIQYLKSCANVCILKDAFYQYYLSNTGLHEKFSLSHYKIEKMIFGEVLELDMQYNDNIAYNLLLDSFMRTVQRMVFSRAKGFIGCIKVIKEEFNEVENQEAARKHNSPNIQHRMVAVLIKTKASLLLYWFMCIKKTLLCMRNR